ncbi:MAG: hypothetical protein HKN70_14885 [Gammaproteobacteria bacterium]|nr:hypothetical protein [Gammaproteobacteria bacterium]
MNLRTLLGIALVSTGVAGCATSAPQACHSNSPGYGGTAYALAETTYNGVTASGVCNTEKDARTVTALAPADNTNCSFKKGLFAGEHGVYPDGNCDDSNWNEYETGYTMGRKIYDANNRLEIVSEALETSRTRLWLLESSPDGIGQAAEISRVKANIEALIQVRDLESRRLHNLHADNTH